jgi:competence protein ComEA
MNDRRRARFPDSAGWLFVVAAIIGAFSAGWAWQAANQPSSLPPLFEDAPATQLSKKSGQPGTFKASTSTRAASAGIIVHVTGAVHNPSVVKLASGSRVRDAIRAVGGAKPEGVTDAINLAAPLEDGQQIRVPTRNEVLAENNRNLTESRSAEAASAPAKPLSRDKKPLPSQPINVNAASEGELQSLPGIGPALAARIVAYRSRHGAFKSIRDLDQVKGLGPKKLEALRPWARFG